MTRHPRPRFSIADIVRRHRRALESTHRLSLPQRRLLGAIAVCRTPALGGHLHVCQACGEEHLVYHSCRRRGCPNCQAVDQERWIEARSGRILPIRHFHVVFTLPSELRHLARKHPGDIHDTLFRCVAEVLGELGRTRMKAIPGWTMVLHTWTRDLRYHPHIHALVTAGGLSLDGQAFVPSGAAYLFPVQVMAALLRGKMLAALGKLRARGAFPEVGEDDFWELWRVLASHERWVVHARKPFAKTGHVLAYLGRYTHRVGISDSRLLAVTDAAVTFATRNGKTATLDPVEFLERFLQHVLPGGFHKIRHGGLYADAKAGGKLERARALLTGKDNGKESGKKTPSFHLPERRCPSCGGVLLLVALLPRSPPEAA